MKMDRILLKLSGEALAGEKHTGFDEAVVRDVAKQVKAICDKHIQVSIVIGGGNFWRGRTSDNMDRVKADQIGMLATVMNCIYAADAMRAEGLKTHIMTPFACGSMTELFNKDKAIEYLENGEVVFCRRNRTSIFLNGYSNRAYGNRGRGRCDPFCQGNRRCV